MSEADDVGKNRQNEPLHVQWMLLEAVGDGHKRECPVCDQGILTMMRDSDTGLLLEYDMCCICAQTVIFDDIEFVRKVYP